MGLLQKLFHRHIWQDIEKKFLRKEVEWSGYPLVSCEKYAHFAITRKCVVPGCDKTQIIEKRALII